MNYEIKKYSVAIGFICFQGVKRDNGVRNNEMPTLITSLIAVFFRTKRGNTSSIIVGVTRYLPCITHRTIFHHNNGCFSSTYTPNTLTITT